MDVTKVDLKGNRANVRVAHPSSVGGDIAIKVEVNTEDVAALHPLRLLPMSLRTRQFGQLHADVQTFSSAELIGSKFRALAQRRKGRDLSDVWLARHALDVDDDELADVGDHYLAAAGVSPAALRQGLHEHLGDVEFLADLDTLVAVPYEGYDPEVFGRSLIIWSDSRLDPRFDARRSLNAGRRDRARRQKEGEPDPPLPRCPQYEDAGGSLQRCRSWPDDGVCKMHGALPPPL